MTCSFSEFVHLLKRLKLELGFGAQGLGPRVWGPFSAPDRCAQEPFRTFAGLGARQTLEFNFGAFVEQHVEALKLGSSAAFVRVISSFLYLVWAFADHKAMWKVTVEVLNSDLEFPARPFFDSSLLQSRCTALLVGVYGFGEALTCLSPELLSHPVGNEWTVMVLFCPQRLADQT